MPAASRLEWAATRLGHRFESGDLLTQALTHRSASAQSNERLEYLGDAVLGFVIAAELYDRYGAAPEGDLSRFRSSLVKRETLAEIARELGLEKHLILGQGELRGGGRPSSNLLANALEALLGAVYLDAGLKDVESCVRRLFGGRFDALPEASTLKDPKSLLQEWLQSRGHGLPRYALEAANGAPHDRRFLVVCTVDHREAASSGRGSTRRGAEQEAARRMLATLEDG